MKFTATYTPEDLYEANQLHIKTSRHKWMRAFPALFALMIVLIITLGTLQGKTTDWFSYILPPLLVLVFFYFMMRASLLSRKNMVNNFKKFKNLHAPYEFEIDDKGVSANSEFSSGVVKWEFFNQFRYNDHILMLYPTVQLFYMIPKRCVQSNDDWNKLIDLVKSKIKYFEK